MPSRDVNTLKIKLLRPTSPLAILLLWACCGDSQTEGRTPPGSISFAPMEVARLLYNENMGTSIASWGELGLGGSSLPETTVRYLAYGSRGNRTWVHSQESGGIEADQDTLAEMKEAYKAHFRAVKTNSPSAFISYETPNSFDRTTPDRNWEPREQTLRDAIDEIWIQEGIRVYLAEVNAVIEALEVYNVGGVTITKADVWYQIDDERGPYAHYTELGNFAIGAEMLYAMGFPVHTWTTASITDVTADHKTAALNVITQVPR